jgi:hypothetical protein
MLSAVGDENPTKALAGAVETTRRLCGSDASRYCNWLRLARPWPGADAFFARLKDETSAGQVVDHMGALYFGMIFCMLGFAASFEPSGLKGPDLLIERDGACATVEVTRRRPMSQGSPRLGVSGMPEDLMLSAYGDPTRDIDRAFEKVKGKFPQAVGPSAIIALWNSDEGLEDLEMAEAIAAMRDDPDLPAGLEFVAFASDWARAGRFVRCFAVADGPQPHIASWIDGLEDITSPAFGDWLHASIDGLSASG